MNQWIWIAIILVAYLAIWGLIFLGQWWHYRKQDRKRAARFSQVIDWLTKD